MFRSLLTNTVVTALVAAHASLAFTGRIAVTADGNSHDIDDWAATPGICALIAKAGLKDKLVHFDFSSHIAGSDHEQGDIMHRNAMDAASTFGLNTSVFFDDMKNLSGSVANIAKVVNASSSSDPLTFIMCGPPEVLWRGLDAADASKRRYVTVISHSSWNNNPHDTKDHPNMPHTADDVKALGVKWDQITDQNRSPFVESSMSAYDWMKNSGDAGLQFLYDKIKQVADGYWTYEQPYRPDWSDAGMMYYAITGRETTTMTELKDFMLKGASTPTDPNPTDPNASAPQYTGDKVWDASKGYAVIEVESIEPVSPWQLKTSPSGFSGSGCFHASSSSMTSGGKGTLTYKVSVTQAGTWILFIRNLKPTGVASDACNDVWVKVNNTVWEKVWSSTEIAQGTWSWRSLVTDDRDGKTYDGYRNQLEPGVHTLYLAVRSERFSIDRIAFALSANVNTAKSLSTPQSPLLGATSEPVADPDAEPTSITQGLPAQVVAGQTYTLTGEGGNLTWYYEADSDLKGNTLIGAGSNVSFTIPTTINAPKTIYLVLTGDNGTDRSENSQIMDGTTRVRTAPHPTGRARTAGTAVTGYTLRGKRIANPATASLARTVVVRCTTDGRLVKRVIVR